ncbi:MAG: lipase family protein [Candidatus Sabulitectum sp.]|nr:lipase family protein [Candidatus Sabulitectum sp.]
MQAHEWRGAIGVVDGFTLTPWGADNRQGLFAENKRVLIVAVAGTNDMADVLKDLDLTLDRTPYGDIHSGFHTEAQACASLVWERITKAQAKNKRVVITGHSLGAAIGQVIWAMFGDCDIWGCFFGSPRVGDDTFADHLDLMGAVFSMHERFADPVVSMPTRVIGYRKYGFITYYSSGGNVTVPWAISRWDIVRRAMGYLSLAYFHKASRYRECVDKQSNPATPPYVPTTSKPKGSVILGDGTC